jgi:lathosterol oxidase
MPSFNFKYIAVCLALVLMVSFSCAQTASMSFWEGNVAANIGLMKAGAYNPYKEFNQWFNELFFAYTHLGFIPRLVQSSSFLSETQKYYLESYLRDLVSGTAIYWLVAGGWHVVIYKLFKKQLIDDAGKKLPSWDTMAHQMWLSQRSLLIYAMLPIISEFLIEGGYTRAYFYVDQVGGWGFYALYSVMYLTLVEIGIYWMHRTLHTNPWLYKNIHKPHHKYKSQETLTPWASIAFHPLDGMLQASPYVACLFIVPIHYYTHMIMLFFTSMWATNIHDSMDGDTEPIMGSKYHTVHHTDFNYNYGQFFIFCDKYWGTLRVPKVAGVTKSPTVRADEKASVGGGESLAETEKSQSGKRGARRSNSRGKSGK